MRTARERAARRRVPGYFDGFSIGSNDLTQLTRGLERDSALVAEGFDERNPAGTRLLELAVRTCRANGKYLGICG